MPHEIQVTVRGPEGMRGYRKYRVTKKGADDVIQRMLDGVDSEELLVGVERDEPTPETPAQPQE